MTARAHRRHRRMGWQRDRLDSAAAESHAGSVRSATAFESRRAHHPSVVAQQPGRRGFLTVRPVLPVSANMERPAGLPLPLGPAFGLRVRGPAAAAHIAGGLILFVHAECRRQGLRRVAAFHNRQIAP